ncbi:hypothetical protein GIB67_022151 [Kingdonia uniflora]|uniref:Uncharacterized protein n=1 Tax=Kingdonia uniflora TaxID=39325 RepID=A0A7J7N8X2_9MAGN|nr:hypothetical protein GIB67_022151 [Kingdonia uniflora]
MKPSATNMHQDLVQEAMRNHIKAPAIVVVPIIKPLVVSAPVVSLPVIGSSSFATEIRAVVVRVCSELEEHGKMLLKLDDHGKMLHNHENLLKQVAPREGLEVVKYLIVDDDVEVNLKAISSEYGGGLLKWMKGDEKDNDDKKDVEKNVKFEEEQPQVVEEEDSELPTVVVYYNRKKDVQHANETMVAAEVAKTDVVFFNQEKVVGEAYQASADQTTIVSAEELTLEVEKTEDEASHASTNQTTAISVEE